KKQIPNVKINCPQAAREKLSNIPIDKSKNTIVQPTKAFLLCLLLLNFQTAYKAGGIKNGPNTFGSLKRPFSRSPPHKNMSKIVPGYWEATIPGTTTNRAAAT